MLSDYWAASGNLELMVRNAEFAQQCEGRNLAQLWGFCQPGCFSHAFIWLQLVRVLTDQMWAGRGDEKLESWKVILYRVALLESCHWVWLDFRKSYETDASKGCCRLTCNTKYIFPWNEHPSMYQKETCGFWMANVTYYIWIICWKWKWFCFCMCSGWLFTYSSLRVFFLQLDDKRSIVGERKFNVLLHNCQVPEDAWRAFKLS